MFAHSRNASLWSSTQTVPASFSPTAADDAMGSTISPVLNMPPVSEQVCCQTLDNSYGNIQSATTQTLQGTNYPFGQVEDLTTAFDVPISFRERHRLLYQVYNSMSDPCLISAKDLGNVSRRVGLSMEEVLDWFEDEKSRRGEFLRACQSIQPQQLQQPEHQWPLSPTNTVTCELNRNLAVTMSQRDSQSAGSLIQLQDNVSLPVSSTPLEDHIQPTQGGKRGRAKKQSLTPSASPSPEAKRQKCSTEYPCPDCGRIFTAERWSEHVKRTHFPDQVWECQNINERTGKPCTSKPFFRAANFRTHLGRQHGYSDQEISRLVNTCKFSVMNFFHQKCGFLGCDHTFDARDESIDHIKNHFRQLAEKSNPPKDLGVSQWKENCSSAHILKRGVHYRVIRGTARKTTNHDRDRNNDGSGNSGSSNQPHDSSGLRDDKETPNGEDNSSGAACSDSSQDSSYMRYGQYPASSTQICPKSEFDTGCSNHVFGLEKFLLPFTIRRRLGFGGHGLVDEVVSDSCMETFARKSVLLSGGLSDTSMQMFHLKNELTILKGLSHPHLVRLIGAYADAKYSHIIMSPVADQNLADYLFSSHSGRNRQLSRWMGCLASAIYYLHGRGIQHLDIKPQNILLKGNNILLADFGTAKSIIGWPVNHPPLAVTPMYSAPETMLHGHQEYASDIFSLGCVFSEMLTRQSGRSIGQFEDFRSRAGKKAFHLTISEVRKWITFLPWTITSDGLPLRPAEDHKKLGQAILQMLAMVPSDRPMATELQSRFMDLSCLQCEATVLRKIGALEQFPLREGCCESRPACGTGVSATPVNTKLSGSITYLDTSAVSSPEGMDIDRIKYPDQQNDGRILPPFSPSSEKASIYTRIAKISGQIPALGSCQYGDFSGERLFPGSVEKSDCTHSTREEIFKDVNAEIASYQTCPIQTFEDGTKGFEPKHDKHRHVLSHCEDILLREGYPWSKSVAESSVNRGDIFDRRLTRVYGHDNIPQEESTASSGVKNMSFKTSEQHYDHSKENLACFSTAGNEPSIREHGEESITNIDYDLPEEPSVRTQPIKETNTNPNGLGVPQETIHRGNSQLKAVFDMPVFSPEVLAGNSNYMILPSRSRTYSVSSNDTSDHGFDSPAYSKSGDPGTPATEFADDTHALDQDAKSVVPYDPTVLLSRLYSKVSFMAETPYDQAPSNSEAAIDQVPIACNDFQSALAPQLDTYQSTASPNPIQNFSVETSALVNSQSLSFPTGFNAFVPSIGPFERFDPEPAHVEELQSRRVKKSRLTKKKSYSRTLSLSKAQNKLEIQGWEQVFTTNGGLHRASELLEEETTKRGGKRSGGLEPRAKDQARRMRKQKACWNCWVHKVPCSEGKMCIRCDVIFKKQFPSPLAHQLCCRSGFKDYESTFFPNFLHSHLKKRRMEDIVTDHVSSFFDTVIMVEVSTGAVFKPLRLQTNFFQPKTGELLLQPSLLPAQAGQLSQLVLFPSAPIGILGLQLSEMKKKCDIHIENMIANHDYSAQTTAGDLTQLPFQILEIVWQYGAGKKDVPLLRNALKLHAIHYFMSSLVTFTPKSTDQIYTECSYSPFTCRPPYLSSRLLNRQIKYAMHKLHHKVTVLVLEGLERALRTRSKDSWGPSLCAMLILCLCIENLQTAVDILVVCSMQEHGEEAAYTRDQSFAACQELDEYPFRQFVKLFHDIYRTHKARRAGAQGLAERGFNPFTAAAKGETTGLDSSTEEMIKGIYSVVCNHWTEISDLSERSSVACSGFTVEPNDIKANNTGRLASKFLRSFFVTDD